MELNAHLPDHRVTSDSDLDSENDDELGSLDDDLHHGEESAGDDLSPQSVLKEGCEEEKIRRYIKFCLMFDLFFC